MLFRSERDALRALGLSVLIPYPTLPTIRNSVVLHTFSLIEKEYLILHFFAGNKGRSISPEHAHALVAKLRAQLPNLTFLISGALADKDAAHVIAHDLVNTRVIAGDATLQEMMALIAMSRGVVSVDTGIAHITAHLRKPLIVLRTCLWPNWWFPTAYGKDIPNFQFSFTGSCDPHQAQNYPDCLNKIDLEEVTGAAIPLFT